MSFAYMLRKFSSPAMTCVACVAVFFIACSRDEGGRTDTVKANKALVDEIGRLYHSYLAGDSVQARNSLLEEVRVIEGAEWLPPQDKANLLFVTYSRQYVFYHKQKQEVHAVATWIKVRFWSLRRFELSGLETESAMKEVEVFTPQKIIETIESWDRRENNGQLPQYRRVDQGSTAE